MAIEWPQSSPDTTGGLIADRRLWLTQDDRLVEDGALDAAKLLAGAGHTIPVGEVSRLGLVLIGDRVMQQGTATPAQVLAPAEPEAAPPSPPTPAAKKKAAPKKAAPKRSR